MSILKIKDSQGNWVGVPTVKGDTGNGISSAILNDDYTLTLTFTDGTTYKTPSIRGEKGEKGEKGEPATDMEIHICSTSEYDAEIRIPTIANPNDKTFYLVPTEDGVSPDLFTEWVYVNGAWEMFGSAKIDLSGYLTDVQINGTSIVQNGVANMPIATTSATGAVKVGNGLAAYNNAVHLATVSSTDVKQGTNYWKALIPVFQHESTFYGLAKAAGDTTQSQSSNAVGQYTDNAKDSIQNMLGITPLIASHESDPFESAHNVIGELFIIGGKLYRTKTALTAGEYVNEGTNVEVVNVAGVLDEKVNDVQVNGTSITENGVANIPYAAWNKVGVVQVNATRGTAMSGSTISTFPVDSATVKAGTQAYQPITPAHQHESVFYGLAKVAGDSTQSASDNAVGTYTDEAKASIQTMLGVPSSDDVVSDVQINGTSIISNGTANIPMATSSTLGACFANQNRGIAVRTSSETDAGQLYTVRAYNSAIKLAAEEYRPIVPLTQHVSVFYGLAKLAGADMSTSSNEIGTYTDEAKTAIKQMLGVKDNYDSFIVDVDGTDPTITGQPSYRYNCGEVLSLSITPPESGTIDFRFTSGSTPTVLTLPQTVKMPEWWVEVEANTIYEMCITDGVYCGVMSWAM